MKQVLDNIQRVFHPSDNEMKAIEDAMHVIFLEKNEIFLKENELCTAIGFIEHGSMRLFYGTPEKELQQDPNNYLRNDFPGRSMDLRKIPRVMLL